MVHPLKVPTTVTSKTYTVAILLYMLLCTSTLPYDYPTLDVMLWGMWYSWECKMCIVIAKIKLMLARKSGNTIINWTRVFFKDLIQSFTMMVAGLGASYHHDWQQQRAIDQSCTCVTECDRLSELFVCLYVCNVVSSQRAIQWNQQRTNMYSRVLDK